MKRLLMGFVISILGLAMAMNAQPTSKTTTATTEVTTSNQNPAPIVEPEWVGTVYQLLDGKLLPLEKQKVEIQIKAKGFSGGIAYLSFSGKKSSTVLSSPPVFVVKLDGFKGDPSDLIHLNSLTLDGKSGNRIIIVGSQSLVGSSKKVTDMSVQIVFTSYGKNSLKFSPVSGLKPGSYVITTNSIDSESLLQKKGADVAYLFSVD